jgi:hypothetical protein
LGSTASRSQQSVKGNKVMLRTPFKGHYNRTCLEIEEDIPMEQLREGELRHVGLQDGRDLFQASNRQAIGGAKRTLVVLPLVVVDNSAFPPIRLTARETCRILASREVLPSPHF